MNGQHFRELINTVCKTSGLYKYELASLIGVDPRTIHSWESEGVPVRIKPYVISVLRKVLFKK